MVDIYNGPQVWSRLEESFRSLYGGAVIAGGCVRDWEHDQKIKPRDFDIFVPVENDFDFDMRFWALGEPWQAKSYPTNDSYGGQSAFANVLGVAEIRSRMSYGDPEGNMHDMGQIKINLIGKPPEKIADPSLLMDDFDHSLTQFWFDGRRVLMSAAARESMASGKIKKLIDEPRTDVRIFNLAQRKGYERYAKHHQTCFNVKPRERLVLNSTFMDYNDIGAGGWAVRMPAVANLIRRN